MTERERHIYELGLIAGIEHGYAQGWKAADESADAAHRAAYRTVQALARIEPFEVIQLKRENNWLRFRLEHPDNFQPTQSANTGAAA